MATQMQGVDGDCAASSAITAVKICASGARENALQDGVQQSTVDLGEDGLGARDVHVAHVRYVDGDDHLRLQLRICNDRKTFYRAVTEKLDKVRYRLQILASQATAGADKPYVGNRTRKERNKIEQQKAHNAICGDKVAVRFLAVDEKEIVGKSLTVGDALMKTARIEIGDDEYVVLHNQPMVEKVSVMDPVLVGIPVVPLPETDFCQPDQCDWRWYRVDASGAESFLCNCRRYVPTEHDVGFHFRIECHAPSMHTCFARESAAEVTTTAVIPGPDRSVFEPRRRLGATRPTADAFRVMSYNVLFDGYTTTIRAKTEMFPYAKPEAIVEMYRMQLVFQEVEETQADIVCLQEIGKNIFHTFFEPMLRPMGYHTYYTGKTGTTHEGCAVLVRTDCFEIVDERMLDLSVSVRYSQDEGLQTLLAEFPEIEKALRRIPSIAQLLVLRDKRRAGRHVVLANTHLFYREDAHMIRLVQAIATVREIEHVRASIQASDPASQVAVVLCGDFNSFPDTAPIYFLLEGSIDSTHRHWHEAPSFRWNRDGGDERRDVYMGETKRIQHSLGLQSACGIPEFTNFAGTFIGTLDYILIGQQALDVAQVFPLFTREEVSEEVAIPSTKFPSDHISLIADVTWRAPPPRSTITPTT